MTAVFKGSDGAYRFATVTSIVPACVDNELAEHHRRHDQADDLYRAFARGRSAQKAVKNTIEPSTSPAPPPNATSWRSRSQHGIGQAGDGDEVKIRLMVFSPQTQRRRTRAACP